jgi:hypothetical protein
VLPQRTLVIAVPLEDSFCSDRTSSVPEEDRYM